MERYRPHASPKVTAAVPTNVPKVGNERETAEKPLSRYRPGDIFKKKSRKKANHLYLTEAAVTKLKPKRRQYLVWDAWTDDRKRGPDPVRGLAILVSPRGAKSYRVVYYFPGTAKPHYRNLGRVGELSLEEARDQARKARHLAQEGKDPKAGDPTRSGSFEAAFQQWIEQEQKGARQNKSWSKTRGFVLANCNAFRVRPVATIHVSEIERLLSKVRDGDGEKRPRPAAAVRLFAHLRDFFGWCARPGGPITISPMQGMRAPTKLVGRDRVYADDELRAIWRAADQLDDAAEGAFVKLIFLSALRREELAQAKRAEIDDPDTPTLFAVPFERTKGKQTRKPRKYLVPLVPLVQQILRGLSRRDDDALFPPINFEQLKKKLVKRGAPQDFKLHIARHTISTWLENHNHSEYERGLVLNHAGTGVTAGYSHGYPLELKRRLLEAWADHLKSVVQPDEKVVLLR